MELAHSINGVPIRLTYERWYHITENHDDLASHFHDVLEAIQKPDFVVRGKKGSLKATSKIGKKKWLIVIYKEVSKRDGCIITAYFVDTKPKGKIIWRQ